MRVNGSVFVDSRGAYLLAQGKGSIKDIVRDFVEMRQEAEICCDKLYYVYDEGWGIFWDWYYTPYSESLCGISQVAHQMLTGDSNIVCFTKLSSETDFYEKSEPRTRGGFRCEDIVDEEYVCDKTSIDSWHRKWFLGHPDKIDWSGSYNDVFPCIEAINTILCAELDKRHKKVSHVCNNITNDFYDLIVRGMSPNDRISYSEEVGSLICRANYYRRERELEKLEEHYGNEKARVIFSIVKNGKYQFLSIDTQHCMFELCDDKGEHVAELRIDGTLNGSDTKEIDHSLIRVNDWKRKYRKK